MLSIGNLELLPETSDKNCCMFFCTTQPRSRIDLSGGSNKVGRPGAFSVTLRQQREARDTALKRAAAATTIQRCVRESRAIEKARLGLLQELEACAADFPHAAAFVETFVYVAFSRSARKRCVELIYGDGGVVCPRSVRRMIQQCIVEDDAVFGTSPSRPDALADDRCTVSFGAPPGPQDTSPPSTLLHRRVGRTLMRAVDGQTDIARGRRFFSVSAKSPSKSGDDAAPKTEVSKDAEIRPSARSSGFQQTAVILANTAMALGSTEYRRRFSWFSPTLLRLLKLRVFPTTCEALSSKTLPPHLGLKLLYMILSHAPRVLRRFMLPNENVSSQCADVDDAMVVRLILLLMPECPSRVSRLLLAYRVIPSYIEDELFSVEALRTVVTSLQDATCAWQKRLLISLLLSALRSPYVYGEIWKELDAGIARFFSKEDAGHSFAELCIEYEQDSAYEDMVVADTRRAHPFVTARLQALCVPSGSDHVSKHSAEWVELVNSVTQILGDAIASPCPMPLQNVLRVLSSSTLWNEKSALPLRNLMQARASERLSTFLRVRCAESEVSCSAFIQLNALLTTCLRFHVPGSTEAPDVHMDNALRFFSSNSFLQAVDRFITQFATLEIPAFMCVLHSDATVLSGLRCFFRVFFPLYPHPWLQGRILYNSRSDVCSAAYKKLTPLQEDNRISEQSSEGAASDVADSIFSDSDDSSCAEQTRPSRRTRGVPGYADEAHNQPGDLAGLSHYPSGTPESDYERLCRSSGGRVRPWAQERPRTVLPLQYYLEKAYTKRSLEEFVYCPYVVSRLAQRDTVLTIVVLLMQYDIQRGLCYDPFGSAGENVGNEFAKELIIDHLLIQRLLQSESRTHLLHSAVVLGTLLEARLRPGGTMGTVPFESLENNKVTIKLPDMSSQCLTVNVLVYFLNRFAASLLQATYGCSLPNGMYGCAADFPLMSWDKTMVGCVSALLARALRDIHRLRSDVLPADLWVVDTAILKPTHQLMDQVERYRSWQPYSLQESAMLRKGRPADVTVQRTRQAVKTLSILLTRLPHSIRFRDRSLILTLLIMDGKQEMLKVLLDGSRMMPRPVLFYIRRSHIVADTLTSIKLEHLTSWKYPIGITFIDPFGVAEKGIDGGGLFREFLIVLSRSLFSPGFGLFDALPDRSLIPSSTAYSTHGSATDSLFHLAGTVVGKAIYEHIVLEPVFNRTFFNMLQNRQTQHLEDLTFLDPELFKQLRALDHHENIEDFQLTFSATVVRGEGQVEEVDLIPGGRRIHVDRSNLELYRGKLTDFHLNKRFSREAQLFCEGLRSVVPLEWFCYFDALECSQLISGEHQGFDIDDLAAHVEYSGGFTVTSETIVNLWTALKSFNDKQRGQFLMFVTGCPRPPFLGFRMLEPRFKIQLVYDQELLPTSSTCVNQLNLPAYASLRILQEKLLAAIEMTQGFDLC